MQRYQSQIRASGLIRVLRLLRRPDVFRIHRPRCCVPVRSYFDVLQCTALVGEGRSLAWSTLFLG